MDGKYIKRIQITESLYLISCDDLSTLVELRGKLHYLYCMRLRLLEIQDHLRSDDL